MLDNPPKKNSFFPSSSTLGRMFQKTDWTETSLGDPRFWPQSLKTVVRLMLDSEFPMFIAWGPKRIFLYNDAYSPILGNKHPSALGQEFESVWSEIWADLYPLVKSVDSGNAVYQEDLRLIMRRSGYDEELFFTFSYSPIFDDLDRVAGLYCACVETTERVRSAKLAQKSLDETAQSERELVDTLESMSDAFFSLDKDWRFTRVNKQHERLTKKSRDEQIGRTLTEVWFKDLKYQDSVYLKAYKKVMSERVSVSFIDYYHPLKLWTEVRAFPKSDGGLAVFFTDITERKRTESEIKETNEQLKLAINAANLGTFHWNFFTSSGAWSDLAYKLMGISANQSIAHFEDFANLVHPADRERLTRTWAESIEAGEGIQCDFRSLSDNGGDKWVSMQTRLFSDNEGKPSYLIGTLQDITERKLRQIEFERNVDVSPAILWITDKDGSCNYLSKQWYEVTGQTPEEALGFGWLDATHPDDKQRTADLYAKSNTEQKPFYAEYRLRTKSGAYRWAVDAGNPRFDKDHRYLGYAGTVFDIHDQKVATEAIEDLNRRFKRSAQATDLGVWYCDLPFETLIWNDEVKKHFFIPPDCEVTIDLFYARIHPEDRERTRASIKQSIDSRTPYDTIYRTVNPSNSDDIKSVRAIGWTDYNLDGVATRFDGITLDVTDELLRRAELESAKNDAEHANRLKSSFLANMSHEIRTPLSAILGFTDLLKDPTVRNEDRAHFLETISRNGKALTRIIDDILDLAKVESGKLDLEQTEFSFFDLFDDVMDLFRERTRAKGIYLHANYGKGTPSRIICDPTRLRQIFINIIGNAVKFTEEGGVRIEVTCKKLDDSVFEFKVSVEDTGLGIEDDKRLRIFQPFMQADNTTTRKFGGTGLGLALSKRLANALNGDIYLLESTPGHGSTFIITFIASSSSSPASKKYEATSKHEASVVLSGIRILLVDDSKDNLVLLSQVLTRNGAQVEIAMDGIEAFRKGVGESFDIVLMDIQMPNMDGFDATRSLREAGFSKPIIALTAHAMPEERARSFAAGCNGHLTKPLNREELLRTIQSFTRQNGTT